MNRKGEGLQMDYNLESSRLQSKASRGTGDFAEIAGHLTVSDSTANEPTSKLDALDAERLAERTRIAQELHDTLLQGFLGVAMQLHVAVDHLPAGSAAKERLARALEAMDRVLEEGRSAVQGLRSSQVRFPSLSHALASVPSDLGLPSSVGFQVVVEGQPRELTTAMRDELYRIGREAIVNAYRHSRAKRIEAEIQYRSTEVRLAVRDNGCGIDPEMLHRNGHWGLQGMQERAERIGARLRIWSKAALGTEVELCIPARVAFSQAEIPTA
jgi:signal transduction histidine kinase